MGKEKVKLFLLTNDMILYVDNPKDSPKKSIRASKFGKVIGYKINSHKKPVVFL